MHVLCCFKNMHWTSKACDLKRFQGLSACTCPGSRLPQSCGFDGLFTFSTQFAEIRQSYLVVNCAEGCKMGSGVSFHSFPSNSERRKRWEIGVCRKGWAPSADDRLCGKHFQTGKFFLCVDVFLRSSCWHILNSWRSSLEAYYLGVIPTIFSHKRPLEECRITLPKATCALYRMIKNRIGRNTVGSSRTEWMSQNAGFVYETHSPADLLCEKRALF